MKPQYKLYGYRWVILAAFMFINLTIQILWIAYAPITGPAAAFFGVTDLQIITILWCCGVRSGSLLPNHFY
jgi:hypothetical protein